MHNNEALTLFIALRLHFSEPQYDYFLYNGRIKHKLNADKRKDRFQIAKLAKHPNPVDLLVSNLSIRPNIKWLGDIFTEQGVTTYKNYVKRIQSLSYTFKEELKKLKPRIDENLIVPQQSHPYALRLFLGEHISLETLVLIDSVMNFYPYWDKQLCDDIVWQQIRLQIPKYRPFLTFDAKKIKAILQQHFE